MDDIVSSPPSPISRKRAAPESDTPQEKLLNLKGNQFVMPTPPDTDNSNDGSSEDVRTKSRAASPAASSSALSTIESVSATGIESSAAAAGAAAASGVPESGQPPAKRRKLTPAEKLEQQQAREAKEREKAASKARRDEEKRIKDEEKRRKAEEREAKKREKELEDERRAQEKLKKDRSQMRLGAFFQSKPTCSAPPEESGDETKTGSARRKSMSLEPFDAVVDQIRSAASPVKDAVNTPQRITDTKPAETPKPILLSDYRKTFLPFELPSYSKLAPMPSATKTTEEYDAAQSLFDRELQDPSIREKFDLGLDDSYVGLGHHFPYDRQVQRGIRITSMRNLIDRIQGTSSQPIDLTDDSFPSDPLEHLQQMSIRHLHFSEDVRPAYCGTYTKVRSPRRIAKLRRNPFSRVRTDTDYDYDSEVEWEEPEEGEDLLSDDEDEADDPADAEDIEGFLDDEEDALKNKRKLITGDLVPTNTGICWEDNRGRLIPCTQEGSTPGDIRSMGIDVLLPAMHGKVIDPFSTSYWDEDVPPVAQSEHSKDTNQSATARLMAPPRPPLQQRSNTNGSIETQLIGAAEGEKGPIMSASGTPGNKRGRKPAPKTLSTEDLAEFKEAVVGSPLGKLDLLKGLKTRFPKITQETIKDTLGSHFAQVGNSRVEKKWVYVGPA